MTEISKEQRAIIKRVVSIMQVASDELSTLDDRQKFVGSESERLHSLSLQLLHRYNMMPGQENYIKE